MRDPSPEQAEAFVQKALSVGAMYEEPWPTIVQNTDPKTTRVYPLYDRPPFHNDLTYGDSNHAVSPFAGNGANLALLDGRDLAERLCVAEDSLEDVVTYYDEVAMPRAAQSLKFSRDRIGTGHSKGFG